MIFLDPVTGVLADSATAPGVRWQLVPGYGALFRRREEGGWKAAHAYGPDAPLWHRRGWERVRLRPASLPGPARRGRHSALRYCFADQESEAARTPGRPATVWVWVILPDEVGWETPAPRPGAQARFRLDAVALGVPAEQLAERLFVSRILALDIPLERALWVLKGPPVSPEDARLRRKMEPVLRLAERLSLDLAAAAPAALEAAAATALPAAELLPAPAASLSPATVKRTRAQAPASRRGTRPRTKRARTGRVSS